MKSTRIVFAGTPEFALASLTALLESGLSPVAVYTQPDRPAGRGKRVTASPVKNYAVEKGLPVVQPHSLRDVAAAEELRSLRPDVLIVAAYGLILPQEILDIPKSTCINVHASALPRWRGAAPIQAAILAGDDTTGVSLMQMTAGLDCGPVYCDARLQIAEQETAGELHDRLASLGGQLLVENLQAILNGEILAVKQDESLSTYAGKIRTQDARLDWQQSAQQLLRTVRAYNPVPGAFFYVRDIRVKCWEAEIIADVDATPGAVLQYDKDDVVIACGKDALRLKVLQFPGKRRAPAHQFVAQLDLRGMQLGD